MIKKIVISLSLFLSIVSQAKSTDIEKITSMFDDYQKEFKSVPIVDPSDKLVGYRSGKFSDNLKKSGFDSYNLKGGILLWIQSGRGLVNKIGETKSVHVYGKKMESSAFWLEGYLVGEDYLHISS